MPSKTDFTSSTMTPREIVQELDRHIVGQQVAKRSVAIALRNRWRRMQLPEELRNEVMPKNILMIGPTGVGKTEIARRLATLANAPFVKVEATRFTEVGYVGKDVEQIGRDLVDTAVKMYREQAKVRVRTQVEEYAEERILTRYCRVVALVLVLMLMPMLYVKNPLPMTVRPGRSSVVCCAAVS